MAKRDGSGRFVSAENKPKTENKPRQSGKRMAESNVRYAEYVAAGIRVKA